MAEKIDGQKAPSMTKEDILRLMNDNGVKVDALMTKALDQAYATHKDQKRDDGTSYLEQHIYPIVADIIKYYQATGKDKGLKIPQEIIIAALLHDILEDDLEFDSKRFIKIFGKRIYDIVAPLTKPYHSDDISDDDMSRINKMMFHEVIRSDPLSILIKLADRTNNMESFYSFKSLDFAKFRRYMHEVDSEYLPYAKVNNAYFYKRLKHVTDILRKRSDAKI